MSTVYSVYILTNSSNTTFYIGVTNNLERRLHEHKYGVIEGFTKRYKLKKLVYFEDFYYIDQAITREKQLKNWHRGWKINLIRQHNPTMSSLDANCHHETSSG